jgi:hypothetical protein
VADVFEEVEEQLRSARYQTMIRKGWPYAAAVIVLALVIWGGYWGWTAYRANQSAKASEAYQQAFDALAANNGAQADKGFAEVAKSGPRGYQAVSLMQEAGIAATDGKTAQAISLLDQAAKVSPDPLLADAATLKSAYLQFDSISLPDLQAKLTPLTVAGRPFSALAREALAMKRMVSGQTAEARQAFALLAIAPDAGEGLQARAQIAMAEIDAGQAPNLTQIAKAAAALTPAQIQAARVAAMQKAAQEQAAQQAAQAAAQGGQVPPGAGAGPAQPAGAAQ